jgi:hypothetical protein
MGVALPRDMNTAPRVFRISFLVALAVNGACVAEIPRTRSADGPGIALVDGAPPPAVDSSVPEPDTSPPPPPPPSTGCDPAFRGPFCTGTTCDAQGNCEATGKHLRIIGFTMQEPESPTLEQIRAYTLAAINTLRARTCLPPLALDDCLNDIAETAYAAVGVSHGYFLANCMNAAHNFGRECECNWTQENGGASMGTGLTWVDGVQNPLCRMMTEPYGKGHRSNIESKHWERIGIAGKFVSSGAAWLHEFGCDLALASCPKNND